MSKMVAIGLRPPKFGPVDTAVRFEFSQQTIRHTTGTWFIREYFDPTRAAKALNTPILDLEPW
jgi:hypothetical protein